MQVSPSLSNLINIIVRDQSAADMHFKLRTTTELIRVFEAYCNKKGVGIDRLKFHLGNAKPCLAHDTPNSLAMRDGDVIHAVNLLVFR